MLIKLWRWRQIMKLIIILSVVILFFNTDNLFAAAPKCNANDGKPFCGYVGKVNKIYVNTNNSILLYFDTKLDIGNATGVGFNVSRNNAAIIKVDGNPEFAKLFYSTALAAQASGRNISIQMRGVNSGYLMADRIWLSAP